MDTGASWCVVGLPCLKTWTPKDFTKWEKVVKSSARQFRFGHNEPAQSLGVLMLSGTLWESDDEELSIIITADVVSVNIPLLISRKALIRMQAIVDVGESQLMIEQKYAIPLQIPKGDICCFHLFRRISH